MNREGRKRISMALAAWLLVLALTGCGRAPLPAAEEPAPTQAETVAPETWAGETEPPETEPTETVPEETMPAQTEPPETEPEEEAQPIFRNVDFLVEGGNRTSDMRDGDLSTRGDFSGGKTMTITSKEPIGALYISWYKVPPTYTLSWDGGSLQTGELGFLHAWVQLPEAVTTVTIRGDAEDGLYAISELQLYTPGAVPEGVQNWLPPLETADILAFVTHSDDDTLYFGCALSYYAMERGLDVQTAFLVEHPIVARSHERLDGLWEMGIRHYPVVAGFQDFRCTTLESAAQFHQEQQEDVLTWQVEQIRRFRPLVILGHDLQGEYGHGQHMLNAHCLTQAVELAAQEGTCEDSARRYGVWDTPKLYLHMYEENQILLDVNTPLTADSKGRSPYEISCAAFWKHYSQQGLGLALSRVTDERRSDCRCFGLYRSLVENTGQTDMMAGIDPSQWR